MKVSLEYHQHNPYFRDWKGSLAIRRALPGDIRELPANRPFDPDIPVRI
jgi:hypothetical protein